MIFYRQNKLGKSTTVLALTFILLFSLARSSFAVMPPQHYQKQARMAMIKAIAIVKDVKVLSESKYYTTKKVRFELEKALDGRSVPQEFFGTCRSVDHKWQDPGAGGTLYYYPTEGTRVFVTISFDGGPIDTYRELTPELEKDLRENGMRNVFRLAYSPGELALAEQKKVDTWFLFNGPGQTLGYLHISRNDSPGESPVVYKHEFLAGQLDKERTLYTMTTSVRNDATLSPERITLDVTYFSTEETKMLPQTVVNLHETPAEKTKSGILADDQGGAIPPETVTDFILFSLIEKLPYTLLGDRRFQVTLLETLEMYLKKDVTIQYGGQESSKNQLHRFDQTGPAKATYWLDENHELKEVHWDDDKIFKRSTEAEAMTVLQ
jgi:hypothetical protein